MEQKDLDKIIDHIKDYVNMSHIGVANSVSDNVQALDKTQQETNTRLTKIETILENLLEQKKIQNGKVNKNSENIQKLIQWKYWIMGGLGVIIFIVPYFSYMNTQQVNNIQEDFKSLRTEIRDEIHLSK